MAEYIEREAAIDFVKQNTPNFNGETTMKCVEGALKKLPAAEVIEVRHGKWKKEHNKRTCSVCGFFYYNSNTDFNFCPNCGAEMDKKWGVKAMTNIEKVKLMSVEEMAEFIYFANDKICFDNCKRDTSNKYECKFGDDLKPENCINCMREYLESEVGGE